MSYCDFRAQAGKNFCGVRCTDTSPGNLFPVIVSDRVGALRTAEWRKPRQPTAGAAVTEPETNERLKYE